MRIITTASLVALSLATFTTTVAVADGHAAAAIKERQAVMKGYGKSLGVLGDMAKGQTDYDASAASAAATELAKLANMDHSGFWPKGSDTSVKGSRALPKLWDNLEDVKKIEAKLAAASDAMVAIAGDGLPAIRGAIGGIGAACGECHKSYRQPK